MFCDDAHMKSIVSESGGARRDDVSENAESFFGRRSRPFDHRRIDPYAGREREDARRIAVDATEIDAPSLTVQKNSDRIVDVERERERMRDEVAGPRRDNSDRNARAFERVEHSHDCAVAAKREDSVDVRGSLGGEPGGVAVRHDLTQIDLASSARQSVLGGVDAARTSSSRRIRYEQDAPAGAP